MQDNAISNKEGNMIDLLKKNLYVGLGLVSMTRDKIVEVGKKIAEDSKLSESEGKKFVDELLKQADESKENLQAMISKAVEKTASSVRMPCTANFEKMGEELKKVNQALARIEEQLSKK